MIKIVLVIKTSGLEYDDRVRKEILTIEKLYPNIKFKIFAMLPDNVEHEGVTAYGVPYKQIFIPARDKYPSAQKVILKAYQFYKAAKKDLADFDVVWAANVDASFFPMLCRNNRIVWDLHELPERFLSSRLKKWILKYIFRRCKIVIHANPQREQYLESIDVISSPQKHYALRNYPNFDDVDTEYDYAYKSFVEWRKDRKCVYLQGLNMDDRAAYESIAAVLKTQDLVVVVIGGYDKEAKTRLIREFGSDIISEKVYFAGQIAQLKIPQYMKECFMSLVFYKNINPNNYYCEANRFYQSVMTGLPVVVGNNPSMRELVNQYGFGISINDDGRDVQAIIDAIKLIRDNYEEYKRNIEMNKDKLLWSNQDEYIKKMIETLLS